MTFQAMLENLRRYLAYIAVVCKLSDCLETDIKFSKSQLLKDITIGPGVQAWYSDWNKFLLTVVA